jgi:hypothetical protein
MKPTDGDRTTVATIRPLRRSEIEERIQRVVAEVTRDPEQDDEAAISSSAALRPRWIEPAELVRRMQRYLVYN